MGTLSLLTKPNVFTQAKANFLSNPFRGFREDVITRRTIRQHPYVLTDRNLVLAQVEIEGNALAKFLNSLFSCMSENLGTLR